MSPAVPLCCTLLQGMMTHVTHLRAAERIACAFLHISLQSFRHVRGEI